MAQRRENVEVSATGRSLFYRSPTDCGVSECDREASIMRRPWPTRGCWAMKKRKKEPSSQGRQFSEEELKDLRTAFGLLDRNRDGRVTASELQFMLQNLGIQIRDEVINELLNEASHSGNGLIDETEFLQWVGRIQTLSQDTSTDDVDDITKDLTAAFRVFDRDGNGYITKDEMKTAMDMIGESVTDMELNDLLALADSDHDGKINYEEFARLLL